MRISLIVPVLALAALSAPAQQFQANYDESKVPSYTLPELLKTESGQPVRDAETWTKVRRPEIFRLFEREMFGRSPEKPKKMTHEVFDLDKKALGGKAVRKQVRIWLTGDDDGPAMDLLIYLPADATEPVPAFLGPNFGGNHTIHSDPAIRLSESWMRPNDAGGIVNNRATERTRGRASSRWAVEQILARGYALATVYYGDIDPDFDDGFKNGIQPSFYKAGQTKPAEDEWGSIGAWAWGLSRALDYLEEDAMVDATRVAVMGHSRLGKTALWAGASDERFALVISNDSGCGGAALSRRAFGETVGRINTSFPHWFADNFTKYNEKEDTLPIDEHELIALMAPRPVYVASAVEDEWADPKGEFLSAKIAGEVYELFGKKGLGVEEMPGIEQPIQNDVGYHIRRGKHDVTEYDWLRFLDFADKHLKH